MSATVADEFPPLLLTDCGPGDALLRRLKLQPLELGVRRTAIALAAVTWIPITTSDFVAMAIPGVIPAIPLAPTVMPVTEVVKGLLKLLV